LKDMGFGLTMTVVGMGATFLTLYILTLVIRLMNRLFPHEEEEEGAGKKEGGNSS